MKFSIISNSMEVEQEDSFLLEDQLNNCRCCLRTLLDDQKVVEINDKFKEKFHELTGIRVSNSLYNY